MSLALNTTLSTSKMVSTCLLNQWINCKSLQIVFGSNRTINHNLNNYGKVYVTVSPGLCLYKHQNFEENGYQMRAVKVK